MYKRQAQTISVFLCLWKLLRMRDVFDLTLHYMKPRSAPIANIIRIGVPSGITQAIFSVAMLVAVSYTHLVQSCISVSGSSLRAASRRELILKFFSTERTLAWISFPVLLPREILIRLTARVSLSLIHI